MQFGFQVADAAGSYELFGVMVLMKRVSLNLHRRSKKLAIDSTDLCIYYSAQCPFTLDCVRQVQGYCERHAIPLRLCPVDTLEKAKQVPCVFQCWAVFYQGVFQTTQLMNEGLLRSFCPNWTRRALKEQPPAGLLFDRKGLVGHHVVVRHIRVNLFTVLAALPPGCGWSIFLA